jgi:O-antigen ligase
MKVSFWPRVAWYLLIISLPFTDILFFPASLKNAGEPSTFLIAATWCAVLIELSVNRRSRGMIDKHSKVLLGFIAVCVVSTVMCYWVPVRESLGESVWDKSARQLAHFAIFASAFWFPSFFITDKGELRRSISIFLGASLVVIVYGMMELITAFLGTDVFKGVMGFFHAGSWYVTPGDIAQVVSVRTPLGILPRLRYIFAEPSMAANFLVLLLCFFFLRSITETRPRMVYVALTLIVLAFIVLTFSLAGYVNVFVVGIASLIMLPPRRRRQYCFVAIAAIVVLFLIPSVRLFAVDVLDRPFRGELSVGMRLASVQAGISMFLSYPLLGVGFGNSVFYIYDHIAFNPAIEHMLKWYMANGDIALPVLNLFVRMFAETGILGGALFIAWHCQVLSTVWAARKISTGLDRLFGTCFVLSTMSVIVGYFSEAGFDKRYWPFALGLAVSWARLAWKSSARPLISQRMFKRKPVRTIHVVSEPVFTFRR